MSPPLPSLADTRAALSHARRSPVSAARSWRALIGGLGLFAGPMALAAAAPALIPMLAIPAALGCLILTIVEHEAAHGSFFGGRRDALLGAMLGVALLAPFGAYREGHAAHHRFSGAPGDPTPAPTGSVRPSRLLDGLLWLRVLPVFYWGGVYGPYLVYALRPTGSERQLGAIARWVVELGLGLALWFGLAVYAPAAALTLVGGWLGAAIAYEHLFTFTQHLGLAPAEAAQRHDHRAQTHFARSVELRGAALLLHFNLHKEHHLAPGLNWQRLPALHGALRARCPEVYRFTESRVRPWARRRGRAHSVLRPTVGDR